MVSSRVAAQERRELVARLMSEREATGETWRSIAARTGINYATLTGWAWRLRREGRELEGISTNRAQFIELVTTDERSPASTFELLLRCDRRVRVDAQFDEAALARLVRVLEAC